MNCAEILVWTGWKKLSKTKVVSAFVHKCIPSPAGVPKGFAIFPKG